jgi:sugar transferase EpsL
MSQRPRGVYARVGKRTLDLVGAACGLLLIGPVLLGLWVLVRMQLGRPALFVQTRPGEGGRLFRMLKFRTMTDERDTRGKLLPDAQRITAVGSFLRRTSLDELPELLNVIKGDMSLVGPRPLLVEYLSLYSPEEARRHDVKPGITGWAQINGRNDLSWEDKFKLDVWYVDNQSISLDLKILVLTLAKVVKREGISAQGEATMTRFTGSR